MSPDTTNNPEQGHSATDRRAPEPRRPGALSEHDPPANDAATTRPPLLIVIAIVVIVTAVVILHLTGVLGPGSH